MKLTLFLLIHVTIPCQALDTFMVLVCFPAGNATVLEEFYNRLPDEEHCRTYFRLTMFRCTESQQFECC